MNERKLTKSELKKREDIIMNMKGNKRDLVKKYGKDAESVMYGRATNMAKKQSEGMNSDKLREMIKDSLKNPKAADLNKDGKLSDYEEKRGAAIEKNLDESSSSEEKRMARMAIKKLAKYRGVSEEEARQDLIRAAKELGDLNETQITENKQEAADELQMIMEQLYELSDQAKMIFRNNFPTEYRRLDAYGALDFGTSSNRYDVTLEGTLENLDMEDYDEDLNEELNISLADLEERGYKAGEKAAYTYGTLLGKLKNRPDKLAYNKGFMQGVKDELGSSLSEDLSEDLDLGHQDNEPHMLKSDLYRIGKYAMELYQMVDGFEGKGEVDFPAWWQSKISNAKTGIVGAKHYLDFELKEPQIDAVVDRIDDIAPEMGVDAVSNVEINEEEPGKADMVAAAIQKALNKHKKDDAKTHQLKKARTAMNKGDLSKAETIAKRLAEKLKEGSKMQLDEYTDNNFSGNALIAQTKSPERDELAIYDDFFPEGVASRSNALASLQAHDESPIKARMGRYAPMFVHVQYHEFEDEMAGKYRVHQTQYYNSNFNDKDPNFNPKVSKLSLIKLDPSGDRDKEVNMGSILVKTEDYIRDLKNLNITNRQS